MGYSIRRSNYMALSFQYFEMRSYTQIRQPRQSSKSPQSLHPHPHPLYPQQQPHFNPNPNIKPPRPIQQTKIKQTHCQLTQIPLPYRPELIEELYLSHNQISSVKDRLRIFTNLRNLNLSYNLLGDLGEFLGEVCWGEMGKDGEDGEDGGKGIQLRMLSVRMNRFPYGYQDEIIRRIDSLERFEDFSFIRDSSTMAPPSTPTPPYPQNPKQLFQISHKISQHFLPSYSYLLSSIQSLSSIHYLLEQSPSLLLSTITSSFLRARYQKSISKISALLEPRKDVKYLPGLRRNALRILVEFQMVCMDIGDEEERGDRMEDVFVGIVHEILVMFGSRNCFDLINTLKNQLQKRSNQYPDPTNPKTLPQIFGKLFNATRHPIHEPNPGKYLPKLNPTQVKQHKFLQFINHDNPKQREKRIMGLNTLDGDRRRTRNTMMRDLGKVGDGEDAGEREEGVVYERVPIILYERNYLEVIQEIWQLKLRNFIKIYDIVYRQLTQMQQTLQIPSPKFINFELSQLKPRQKQEGKTVPVHPKLMEFYLQQDDQTIGPQSKREEIKVEVVQKSKNGGKQNCLTQNTVKDYSFIMEKDEPGDIGIQRNEDNRKTLPKFGNFKQGRKRSRRKSTQHDPINRIPTGEALPIYKKQESHSQNLAKYSIYQINLVYKVLTALKKYKNKKSKARSKALPLNTYN